MVLHLIKWDYFHVKNCRYGDTVHPIPVFSYNWAGLNLSIKLCGWTRHSVLHYIEFLSLLLFSMIQIRQWNQYISSIKQCTVCIVLYITILYYRIKTNNNVDSSHKKSLWNNIPTLLTFVIIFHVIGTEWGIG